MCVCVDVYACACDCPLKKALVLSSIKPECKTSLSNRHSRSSHQFVGFALIKALYARNISVHEQQNETRNRIYEKGV